MSKELDKLIEQVLMERVSLPPIDKRDFEGRSGEIGKGSATKALGRPWSWPSGRQWANDLEALEKIIGLHDAGALEVKDIEDAMISTDALEKKVAYALHKLFSDRNPNYKMPPATPQQNSKLTTLSDNIINAMNQGTIYTGGATKKAKLVRDLDTFLNVPDNDRAKIRYDQSVLQKLDSAIEAIKHLLPFDVKNFNKDDFQDKLGLNRSTKPSVGDFRALAAADGDGDNLTIQDLIIAFGDIEMTQSPAFKAAMAIRDNSKFQALKNAGAAAAKAGAKRRKTARASGSSYDVDPEGIAAGDDRRKAILEPMGVPGFTYSDVATQGTDPTQKFRNLQNAPLRNISNIRIDPSVAASVKAIPGDTLYAKLQSLMDTFNKLSKGSPTGASMTPQEIAIMSNGIKYINLLGKAVQEFEASSAGTAFEAFLAMLAQGVVVGAESGASDLIGGDGTIMSAKLLSSPQVEQSPGKEGGVGFEAIVDEQWDDIVYIVGLKTAFEAADVKSALTEAEWSKPTQDTYKGMAGDRGVSGSQTLPTTAASQAPGKIPSNITKKSGFQFTADPALAKEVDFVAIKVYKDITKRDTKGAKTYKAKALYYDGGSLKEGDLTSVPWEAHGKVRLDKQVVECYERGWVVAKIPIMPGSWTAAAADNATELLNNMVSEFGNILLDAIRDIYKKLKNMSLNTQGYVALKAQDERDPRKINSHVDMIAKEYREVYEAFETAFDQFGESPTQIKKFKESKSPLNQLIEVIVKQKLLK